MSDTNLETKQCQELNKILKAFPDTKFSTLDEKNRLLRDRPPSILLIEETSKIYLIFVF